MYTQRRTFHEDGGIPQNYSGNAFRYPPIRTYEQEGEREGSPPDAPSSQAPRDQPPEEKHLALPQSPPSKENDHTGPALLFGGHGISGEELLLLGRCLLLSGDGGGLFSRTKGIGDVVPYLLLLLFFG